MKEILVKYITYFHCDSFFFWKWWYKYLYFYNLALLKQIFFCINVIINSVIIFYFEIDHLNMCQLILFLLIDAFYTGSLFCFWNRHFRNNFAWQRFVSTFFHQNNTNKKKAPNLNENKIIYQKIWMEIR